MPKEVGDMLNFNDSNDRDRSEGFGMAAAKLLQNSPTEKSDIPAVRFLAPFAGSGTHVLLIQNWYSHQYKRDYQPSIATISI